MQWFYHLGQQFQKLFPGAAASQPPSNNLNYSERQVGVYCLP